MGEVGKIWIQLDANLTQRRAQYSRVPCVGERIAVSEREPDLVVYRVVHVEGRDVVAIVYLTSETGYAAMRRQARRPRWSP